MIIFDHVVMLGMTIEHLTITSLISLLIH